MRIATAWQLAGAGTFGGFQVGILSIDWAAGRIQIVSAAPVPTRAHGLLPLADGGFVAVANRPGRWLLRLDAQCQKLAETTDAAAGRTFNGHAEADASGQWLFTSETNTSDGRGWVTARDVRTLKPVAEFPSGGLDPHQLLRAPDGSLMVANGGIPRDAAGRKTDLARMAPSLARIALDSGNLTGQWTLPDPRLSIRHLAWSTGEQPLLGLALQAEHDEAAARAQAPALAVWSDPSMTGSLSASLAIPSQDPAAAGYVGDIAAAPGHGFVLSAQRQDRALWWQPAQPDRFTPMAELTEPCALLPWMAQAGSSKGAATGVILGAGRGIARWQPDGPSSMLRWPVAMAPDNHAVKLL